MALVTIPTTADTADFRQVTDLDGATYNLRLRWNSRDAAWSMDVLDANETPLVLGQKCVSDFLLLHAHHMDGMPAGHTALYNATGNGERCDREQLGARHFLIYQEAE